MRWKAVIPISVILAGIFVFFVFFGNKAAKGMIEGIGSGIVGAKVEVGKLRLSLFSLSLELRELQVASPSDAWKNMFQAGRIAFSLNPRALLSKKFVIREMSVADMASGTPRKTSGKLPEKPKPAKKKNALLDYGEKLLSDEFAKLPVSDLDSSRPVLT